MWSAKISVKTYECAWDTQMPSKFQAAQWSWKWRAFGDLQQNVKMAINNEFDKVGKEKICEMSKIRGVCKESLEVRKMR